MISAISSLNASKSISIITTSESYQPLYQYARGCECAVNGKQAGFSVRQGRLDERRRHTQDGSDAGGLFKARDGTNKGSIQTWLIICDLPRTFVQISGIAWACCCPAAPERTRDCDRRFGRD